MGDPRRAHVLRRRGRPGRRHHDQKPRGTQVAVRRKEVSALVRPHCALGRVDGFTVTDPIGGRGLLSRVLYPVQNGSRYAPRSERHEEDTGRKEAESTHGTTQRSGREQDAN